MSDDPEWDERLKTAAGPELAGDVSAFIARLPAGYRALTIPSEALDDIAQIAALEHEPDPGQPTSGIEPMGHRHRFVVRPPIDPACTFRLRRFGPRGIELTSALPVLESFGLVVVESAPLRLLPDEGAADGIHIDDIGIRVETPYGPETLRFVPTLHGRRLVEAVEASAAGDADVDSLNRLVTVAGLEWRQVALLRSYLRYWRQAGLDLSWPDLCEPLVAHPDAVRALVAYFQTQFDPAGSGGGRAGAERTLALAQLDLCASLEEDRVLRGLLGLIDATRRTNFYVPSSAKTGSDAVIVLKFESAAVPELPAPRPRVETFVHGPAVEGVHLRAGLIARGGIRWSERPTDFRTEVLDLAFAQVKKNAIIVPTGAKGGFVCRTANGGPTSGLAKARPTPEQVRHSYSVFVAGLLQVTDNLVGGQVVTPEGVTALDGPDPYLVVAADKGTATFSDLANSISETAGFWLGDAFASGGSRGYDHKAMGITARGAWVAVRRHFRELDIDVSSDPIQVVGVGDMSGDVFGNGMLQSRSIRLVGAFDHRHVFLDPNPDPDRSFEERRRLAELPSSSWADYQVELVSPGGGVWSRDAKSIPLSSEARAVLGVTSEALSPPQLISIMLAAPVDLLWFGGIGTFVKAPGEADADVADHANDAVRITSDALRARVVAEGANLGITQQARIRYSRRGGRINADFIDNAAGVATSDREVNLKILLALAIERGRLAPEQRDHYLVGAEDEVAQHVLLQVDHSVAALNRAASTSERDLDAYEALLDEMEASGHLDRRVEVLPDAAEFQVRREAGAGLIRPELATILAYTKSGLVAAMEQSEYVADPVFLDSVVPYFPTAIRADFADLIPEHRLYPQLVATDVAGEMVDQMGIVWAHDLAAEMGRSLAEVAAAFWVARGVTGAGELWAELESLMPALPAVGEAALHAAVSASVSALARRYLSEPGSFPAAGVAARDRELRDMELPAGGASDGKTAGGVGDGLDHLDLPAETVQRFRQAARRVASVQAARLAAKTGRPIADTYAAFEEVGQAARVDRLAAMVATALTATPPAGRFRTWQGRALLDDLVVWQEEAAARLSSMNLAGRAEVMASWPLQSVAGLSQAAASGRADPLSVADLALRRLRRAIG